MTVAHKEAIALAREHTPEAIRYLLATMRGETEIVRTWRTGAGKERTDTIVPTIAERTRAAELLLERALGKAKEFVEVSEGTESQANRAQLSAELLEKLRRALPEPAIDVTPTK